MLQHEVVQPQVVSMGDPPLPVYSASPVGIAMTSHGPIEPTDGQTAVGMPVSEQQFETR